MMDEVRIGVNDQQQPSLDSTQDNNGNDRSLTSTGGGAQEKSIPITVLLEKKVAKMLGVVACGWAVVVLVPGGSTLETKDLVFVTMLFFLVCFRCWGHYCNQATGSLTEADYSSRPNNNQQFTLPIRYINRFLYWSRLVSAIPSVVFSIMRLASGKKEVANFQDFSLKVFYGLTLAEALVLLFAELLLFAEALVLLFAEALSFPIRGNPENGRGGEPGVGSENRRGGEPRRQMNAVQLPSGRMNGGEMNVRQRRW